MVDTAADDLFAIPHDIGRIIIETGAVVACPLLGTDKFVRFCKERGLSVDRDRLFRLERLRLIAPVFRVLTPPEDVPALSIPPHTDNNWFERGWAWDTTTLHTDYAVPDRKDHSQEAYYSMFQIDDLHLVLSVMDLRVEMDSYLESSVVRNVDWPRNGERWLQFAKSAADSFRASEYRRALALLCQFISNRYYPQTQGDQRRFQLRRPHSSDYWTVVNAIQWDWHNVVRNWKSQTVEQLFRLTPRKLRHAYEALAIAQAYCDPIEKWYQLTQFVKVNERIRLKGSALRAETLRSGAHMLRLLYRDLYGDELPCPNEATNTIITHFPELKVRKDTRRFLELVVNRYGLNPQPTLSLIVEGPSEEKAVTTIFEQCFGTHPGTYGIEIIVLGGVDAATGTKEDRFRAIIRLIDYLHHHQTFTFLILDNERYARKLKVEAQRAKSIHSRRYVTRPEYLKIWTKSFEFDNFSSSELATALTTMAAGKTRFSRAQIDACRQDDNPGAKLKAVYQQATGKKLNKMQLCELLVVGMFSATSRQRIENRPITKTLQRVATLAAHNHPPTFQEVWEKNQASGYFGRKR